MHLVACAPDQLTIEESTFKQLLLELPKASENEILQIANAIQTIIEQKKEKITDFEVKQAGLHIWNCAVRLKQLHSQSNEQNCEGNAMN